MLVAENASVNRERTSPSALTMSCRERLRSASETSMSAMAAAAQRQSASAKERAIKAQIVAAQHGGREDDEGRRPDPPAAAGRSGDAAQRTQEP